MHRTIRSARGTAVSLALVACLGATAVPPVSADPGDRSPSPARAQTLKPLEIKRPTVSCECGGAGYLWGWSVVFFQVAGQRDGFSYRAVVTGGGERRTMAVEWGVAVLPRATFDFQPGERYSFVIEERRGRRVVRASDPVTYEIPTPVDHPGHAAIDTVDDGETGYLVAGRTHTVSFDGTWGQDAVFAKGVDRYLAADGSFGGYYADEAYPLPWTQGAEDPSLALTPTEDHIGQTWSIQVVGSRPAPRDVPRRGIRAGDPIPGSEWGFTWSLEIISEEDAAKLEGAPSSSSAGSR